MKDYTVRRYTFEELGEEARERAVQDMRNFLLEVLDSSDISDYLMDRVEFAIGGQEAEIDVAFSLSYCQGDGVAIYGVIRRENAPDLSWPEGAESVHLTRNSWGRHYSHYNSFNVEVYDGEDCLIEDSHILETQLRDLCRELERDGYKYIEGATSEEVAGDELREADAVFTIEGKWDVPAGVMEEAEL